MKKFSKKGFQLTISTIIVFILGFMLLLFLVLFFTGASGDFLAKTRSYFSYSNVDNVIEGCNILIDTNAEYAFCCEKKTVKYYFEGKKSEGEFSCSELVGERFIEGRINDRECDLEC